MARRAGKFRRLSPAEQWLALRIVGLLVLVRMGLWTLPFRTVAAFSERLGQRRWPKNHKRLSSHELTSLITVAADYVPQASCLTQAFVAQAILKQYWYEPVLRLGVARSPAGQLQAHAWVECDGQVVIGESGTLGKYSAFPEIQPPKAVK